MYLQNTLIRHQPTLVRVLYYNADWGTMFTIVFAFNMINDFINPDTRFLDKRVNIGESEIDRLMGRGESYGKGILPVFLNEVEKEREAGRHIDLIFVRDYNTIDNSAQNPRLERFGTYALSGSEGADLVAPISEIGANCQSINATTLSISLADFQNIIEATVKKNNWPASIENTDQFRFLLVGCHTDKHILSNAIILRNALGFNHVAVSPHLVASSDKDAHFNTLSHYLPNALVHIPPNLSETLSFIGLEANIIAARDHEACRILPEEIRDQLIPDQRTIIEMLCMRWSKVELKPLAGGFSGSALFMANGYKGDVHAEPMVIKVDQHAQMRLELDGYNKVKDLLGMNVPSFNPPVSFGDSTGVSMELAAMEGKPQTLQESFENAMDGESFNLFRKQFENALILLTEKLYRNTKRPAKVVPYRQFELHTDMQRGFLKVNIDQINDYLNDENFTDFNISSEIMQNAFKAITANEDNLQGQDCLVHGDLNLQNIISDGRNNIWLIDWTYSGYHPIEKDFAKLENDIKFVCNRLFELEDMKRLKLFEEYLLTNPVLVDLIDLPLNLRFIIWDFRFGKIYKAIKQIREAFFSLKDAGDWLIYQAALLKYATHTLSFDSRRDRGDCELPQLLWALISVESLCMNLISDDYHLKIRGDRPDSYPQRFRVSLDYASWKTECPEYCPPYHVDPEVLDNDFKKQQAGWADAEHFDKQDLAGADKDNLKRDDLGRLLNPKGRTGIEGRGLLGRWGANQYVFSIFIQQKADQLAILLCSRKDSDILSIPGGFVKPEESLDAANDRIFNQKIGFKPEINESHMVYSDYIYDYRQTDHAWVEANVLLYYNTLQHGTEQLSAGGNYEKISWNFISSELVNNLNSTQATLVRKSIEYLLDKQLVENDLVTELLEKTG